MENNNCRVISILCLAIIVIKKYGCCSFFFNLLEAKKFFFLQIHITVFIF